MNKTDQLLIDIADYVCHKNISSELAYESARLCLLDALSCAAQALQFPECTRLLGPIVPETIVPNGVHVPGTQYRLDPVKAAFDIGILIRWLDYNDTWLAKEWGHPSDNLGAILAAADFMAQRTRPDLTMHAVLTAMIKAYEIQGIIALENSFNELGLDHVILVKIASTAVVTHLLGGNHQQVIDALSQAFLDGQSLRTYRHAPNTASRKSWAAGDATSRAVRLALLTLQGEPGYPSVLSAKTWGFNDVYLNGQALKVNQAFDSYVIENILFKVSYPAEFHGQTAVEAALLLYSKLKDNLDKIDKIIIETQKSAMQIINKQGELNNPADRDHCLQYMVAVALLFGELTAKSYSHEFANTHAEKIDAIRNKITVTENQQMTQDYYDPNKRAIANAVIIHMKDKTIIKHHIDYPLGHVKRRHEALPLIEAKAQAYLSDPLFTLLQGPKRLNEVSVKAFSELAEQIVR
jgi:2-methylcitrate dehydratase